LAAYFIGDGMGEFRVRFRKDGREPYQTAVIEMEGVEDPKEALRKLKSDPQMYRELNYTGIEILDVENVVEVGDL
jgi:hypothetical protein